MTGSWVDAGPSLSQRWADEHLLGDADRSSVAEVVVVPGELSARLRNGPGRAVVTVATLPDEVWGRLIEAWASRLRHGAALLAGDLPPGTEAIVAEAGWRLLPGADEVTARCDQPGHDGACEHVTAVHARFTHQLEGDPFILTTLRGRPRAELLEAVERGRAGTSTPLRRSPHEPAEEPPARGWFDADDDLASISVHPHPPGDPLTLLERLGDPPGLTSPEPLASLVTGAAATAWRLAAGEGADVADEELLLTEVRARPASTAGAVADALGWSPARTREALDRLYEEGTVLRTGEGDAARYLVP